LLRVHRLKPFDSLSFAECLHHSLLICKRSAKQTAAPPHPATPYHVCTVHCLTDLIGWRATTSPDGIGSETQLIDSKTAVLRRCMMTKAGIKSPFSRPCSNHHFWNMFSTAVAIRTDSAGGLPATSVSCATMRGECRLGRRLIANHSE
jgi:hypothetical protein